MHWITRSRLGHAAMAAAALACLMTPEPAAAQFNPAVLEQSVVKVTVTADGKTYSGTGFLWGSADQIVTALHLVQPGGRIVVECRGRSQVAQMARALREADLALLTAPMAPCVPIQSRQDAVPQFGSRLYTFGYGGGAQAGTSKALEKGYTANETLNGILPPSAAQEIRRFGVPSIDLPIYYLQGSLTPGFSGAPVVDDAHRLVGIGDGGMERGASQVSWIIPGRYVDELIRSPLTTAPAPSGQASANLFSADVNVPVAPPVRFTNVGTQYEFVKTKTRSLADLARTSDDPDGVLGLQRRYAAVVPADQANGLLFDVYEERTRGIIITVPAGVPLEVQTSRLESRLNWLETVVRAPDGSFLYSLTFDEQTGVRGGSGDPREVPSNDPTYLDEFLSGYLADCSVLDFQVCQLDGPALRIVDFGNGNRILKSGFVSRLVQGGGRMNEYNYVSLAVRGGISYRAAVKLAAFPGTLAPCQAAPQNPECQNREPARTQLAALLSSHLTTFANLQSANGQRVLETEYRHNSIYDDPNTLRERFYFGPTTFFYNERGKIWQEADPRTGNRVFSEIRSEGDFRVLAFGPEQVRVPIWGGRLSRSSDGGATWRDAGEVRRGRW